MQQSPVSRGTAECNMQCQRCCLVFEFNNYKQVIGQKPVALDLLDVKTATFIFLCWQLRSTILKNAKILVLREVANKNLLLLPM